MKSVIGGVGYRDLRDHTIGPMVSDRLAEEEIPAGVEAHDLSYNPVAVGQWLDALGPDGRPDRMVLVGAIERGREPGSHVAYRWDGILPDVERIQSAVSDAVTGVIHLDNTLIVLAQFGPLPDQLIVLEIEPVLEEFGEDLSPVLRQRFDPLKDSALRLATEDIEALRLPTCPLGGPAPEPVRGEAPPRHDDGIRTGEFPVRSETRRL
jgi:hydrogenase maturation protease